MNTGRKAKTKRTIFNKSHKEQIEMFKSHFDESEQVIDAIREGYIDALVDTTGETVKILTFEGAENAYRIMVEIMDEGALILDSNGIILYANEQFSNLSGIPQTSITGRNFSKFIIPDNQRKFRNLLAKTTRGENSHCDISLKNESGAFVPVYVSSAPLHLEGRTDICIVAADLTERKTAEENLRKLNNERRLKTRLKTILENISEGVLVISADGELIEVNAMAEKLGCEKKYIGHSYKKIAANLKLYDQSGNEVSLENGPAGRGLKGETISGLEYRTINLKKNSEHYFRCSVSPVFVKKTKDLSMVVVSVQDITDQKASALALEKAKEVSEQKVSQLDILNKELESFSHSVIHDLRNPLYTIRLFADILIDECSGKLNEECNEYLKRIKNGSERMNSIIEDLLALSKISRKEIKPVDFDMSGVARLLIKELSELNPGRRVKVKIQDGLRAVADAGLLNAAMRNLLSNAWKYTSKVEEPVVEFGSFEKTGQQIYYVKDNGIGFDMSLASRLFKPFSRLHAEKEFPGIGLGLAIAAKAIGRHNGNIWTKSEPGKGTTFYFTLGNEELNRN